MAAAALPVPARNSSQPLPHPSAPGYCPAPAALPSPGWDPAPAHPQGDAQCPEQGLSQCSCLPAPAWRCPGWITQRIKENHKMSSLATVTSHCRVVCCIFCHMFAALFHPLHLKFHLSPNGIVV